MIHSVIAIGALGTLLRLDMSIFQHKCYSKTLHGLIRDFNAVLVVVSSVKVSGIARGDLAAIVQRAYSDSDIHEQREILHQLDIVRRAQLGERKREGEEDVSAHGSQLDKMRKERDAAKKELDKWKKAQLGQQQVMGQGTSSRGQRRSPPVRPPRPDRSPLPMVLLDERSLVPEDSSSEESYKDVPLLYDPPPRR